MAATGKIGVGIVTHNRETAFRTCLASIPRHKIDVLYVVNDATPYAPDVYEGSNISELIQNPVNLGVGKSKNILLKSLIPIRIAPLKY
jgi:GT2 family glycosyltransferase